MPPACDAGSLSTPPIAPLSGLSARLLEVGPTVDRATASLSPIEHGVSVEIILEEDVIPEGGGSPKLGVELPRWPSLQPLTSGGALRLLDWLGTIVFAISGAGTAISVGMDFMGASVVGVIVAMGGGTIRDVLIGAQPVFWLEEIEYPIAAIVAAITTYICSPHVDSWCPPGTALARGVKIALDVGGVIGLGAFGIVGANAGIRRGFGLLPCSLFGLISGTFGGLIRDTICNLNIRILFYNPEFHATSALVSATLYTAAIFLRAPPACSIVLGMVVSIAMRLTFSLTANLNGEAQ